MLADKSLLSLTLAATFAAGCVGGWTAHSQSAAARSGSPAPQTSAEVVYARQLEALRAAGYDDAEMKEALDVHQRYLDRYRKWWDAFLVAHADNLDLADREFEQALDDLEARSKARREPETR